MTDTKRKPHKFWKKERTEVKVHCRRVNRKHNKERIKKGLEVEPDTKTEGWLTW
jgi:hypothetical protein